mmetsp:Transcript_30095/g.38830  ORF Transcript_30095/g.38830 Transcript_30095/m.38830 type:complete len:99 (+) Transcript_30095:94-390(+)
MALPPLKLPALKPLGNNSTDSTHQEIGALKLNDDLSQQGEHTLEKVIQENNKDEIVEETKKKNTVLNIKRKKIRKKNKIIIKKKMLKKRKTYKKQMSQ